MHVINELRSTILKKIFCSKEILTNPIGWLVHTFHDLEKSCLDYQPSTLTPVKLVPWAGHTFNSLVSLLINGDPAVFSTQNPPPPPPPEVSPRCTQTHHKIAKKKNMLHE